MRNERRHKIIFLNQMAGPLFMELAEDLAKEFSPALVYTGHPDSVDRKVDEALDILPAPEYKRNSNLSRLLSWLHYFVRAFKVVWSQSKDARVFIVSNPPFLGLVGVLCKWLRGQSYMMLVYDIYPDLLIGLGRINDGMLAKGWDFVNRLVYKHSCAVFTIGQDMVTRLEEKVDLSTKDNKRIISIPNWANVDQIKPMAKEQNWFAEQYGLAQKTTLLYSGNMGHTHNIECLLEAAQNLRQNQEIHFLFIGGGAKWPLVDQAIKNEQLQNITLLPFQSENVLPYSLATGDIGIITYQHGTEGCMVPSKTYYYMAAGLALIVLSNDENDLTTMVQEKRCGVWVKPDDNERLIQSIVELNTNPARLQQYKKTARKTAEDLFSRKNTTLFAEALKPYF